MKKMVIVVLSLLALAGCRGTGNGKYNPVDARTFGMVGDVKEVRVSRALLSISSGEEIGDPWVDDDELEMTFDEEGRVTLDPYGDVYEYDERGYFIYGGTDELIRDDDTGRIMSYDNTIYEEGDGEYPDYDIETYFRIRFEYDASGRPVIEEMYGWEWGTTYKNVFEGNKVYPASATFEGGYEGVEEEGTVKYDYSAFDRRGNWTERTVTTVTQSWEEGREDEVETLTEERLERRTIKYWSDKE